MTPAPDRYHGPLVSGLLCLLALILAVCATLSAATSIDWNYAALVAGALAAFFGACVWDRLR